MGFEIGTPVAVAPIVPCRRCFFCRQDMENVCENRKGMGQELDAQFAVDPTSDDLADVVAEATDGRGADAVIVCIGLRAVVNQSFELARKGGRVNVFSGPSGEGRVEIAPGLIHYDQLEVTGSTGSRRSGSSSRDA